MRAQVFHGAEDYQVYTVQPFRLPEWPAGQYLATAMFFAAKEAQGWVKCELLQTLDWGQNWTRVAPGQQFIPLGPWSNGTDGADATNSWVRANVRNTSRAEHSAALSPRSQKLGSAHGTEPKSSADHRPKDGANTRHKRRPTAHPERRACCRFVAPRRTRTRSTPRGREGKRRC